MSTLSLASLSSSPRLAGPLLAGGAAILWGTAGIAAHYAPGGVPAALLGEARMLIGGVTLLLVFGPARAMRVLPTLPRKTLVGTGIAMALFQWAFFLAVSHAGAGVAALVSSAWAPFAAELLAAVPARRMPSTRFWLSLLGVALGIPWLAHAAQVPLSGVLFSLLAGSAYALYASGAAHLQQAPGARNAGLLSTALALLCAALVLLPAAGGSGGAALLLDLHGAAALRGLLVFAWLGLASTALAYGLFVQGLRHLTPGRALALVQLQPLSAVLLGALLLGERFDAGSVAAMGLMATCALLCSFHRAAK